MSDIEHPTWVVYSLAGTKLSVQGVLECEGTIVRIYQIHDGEEHTEFVGLLDNLEFIVRDDDGDLK